MPDRLPFDFEAEFLGRRPASEFVRNGERIPVPAKVMLVRFAPDGSPSVMEISATALDRCQPPLDYATLSRGDRLRIRGDAVIQERGSDRDSYFQVQSAAKVVQNLKSA